MHPRAAVLVITGVTLLSSYAVSASERTPTELEPNPVTFEFWVADPSTGAVGFGSDGDLVSAILTAGDQPVPGREIRFTTTDQRLICTSPTNARGMASCPRDAVLSVFPFDDFTASFDGDPELASASANGRFGALRIFRTRAGEPVWGCAFNEPGTTFDCTVQ